MLDFFGSEEKLDKDGILRKKENVSEEKEVRPAHPLLDFFIDCIALQPIT